MTTSSTRARHRSARRPTTPLNDLAVVATESIGTVGRRTAVVAATSGIFLGMLAAPASAAPNGGASGTLPSVDTGALTASARAVLDTAPVVTAPIEAEWSADTPTVTAVKAPVTRAAARASRAATRTATAAVTAVATSAVPQSVSGNAVLEIAAQYVGTPYVSGGSTPSGFDCSGFTSYIYAQLGISLPRTAAGQKAAGTIVSRADAQPGDLIYSPGHISIYAGGDQQIDSPRPGKSVQFRSIWQSNPVFVRIG